ncbi:MAG: hypothetical protein PHC85_02990 [Candidatus Pacebacteria bacterium]|nr:hypothetical protein [Candidatus Paceibacterota bacterium]
MENSFEKPSITEVCENRRYVCDEERYRKEPLYHRGMDLLELTTDVALKIEQTKEISYKELEKIKDSLEDFGGNKLVGSDLGPLLEDIIDLQELIITKAERKERDGERHEYLEKMLESREKHFPQTREEIETQKKVYKERIINTFNGIRVGIGIMLGKIEE